MVEVFKSRLVLLPFALLAILIAGAAGSQHIKILEPKANVTLAPGDVNVSVEVHDFNLVAKYGQPSVAGEGHIHYFIDVLPTLQSAAQHSASVSSQVDDGYVYLRIGDALLRQSLSDFIAGAEIVKENKVTDPLGTYVDEVNRSIIWKNVTAGAHTIWVELVNNDHTPLSPPVIDEVNVTVKGDA